MPFYPFQVLQAKERASTPCLSIVFCLGLTFGSLKELGACHRITDVGLGIRTLVLKKELFSQFFISFQYYYAKNIHTDFLLVTMKGSINKKMVEKMKSKESLKLESGGS
jgi:hypothetical protein